MFKDCKSVLPIVDFMERQNAYLAMQTGYNNRKMILVAGSIMQLQSQHESHLLNCQITSNMTLAITAKSHLKCLI
jgi:hypothetical protein